MKRKKLCEGIRENPKCKGRQFSQNHNLKILLRYLDSLYYLNPLTNEYRQLIAIANTGWIHIPYYFNA